MPKKKQSEPSSGERGAKMGYFAQDYYCAGLLITALSNNVLQAIRIADPKAGRVDDFQLLREGRVDAWQIKWHTHSGFTTLNELISPDDGTSLIAQLADGRARIKELRPGYRVVVHLATNNLASEHDTKVPGERGTDTHMAAFMTECWYPLRQGTLAFEAVANKWKPWLKELRKASGLAADQFQEFVRDCDLEFGCGKAQVSDLDREAQAKRAVLERVTLFLYKESGSPENLIELTRAELLHRLNLTDSFSLRNRHEFPVDDQRYEPIADSVQQLHALLDKKTGGYLCLLGTPGSGKSTLLTKALQDRRERVIRYYAFVPDDPTTSRGESDNFLHDFVVTLQSQGVAVDTGSMDLSDRANLQQKFAAQLTAIGKEWKDQKKKTIILIDGLDHIEREQHPLRSLLEDLPSPATVPDGVLFVLGTQTDAVVPDRVRHQLNAEVERKIVIAPLTRTTVGEIIRRANFGDRIDRHHHDRIFALSAGHPLALRYLLNRIATVTTTQEVDDLLKSARVFTGNIEADYDQYWQELNSNHPAVIPLMALICRIRRAIDLDWIASWTPEARMKELVETSAHLFKKETDKRWYFFHNSFRLFLMEKTALDYLGKFSPDKDKELHKTLADHCQDPGSPVTWKWQELYHRAKAGQPARVLELTNQDTIRSQFFAGRAQPSIQLDLSLATESLATEQDGVAAIRIGLISDEISHRYHNLDSDRLNLIKMLISTSQVEKALFWIRDANRLIIADSYALQLCNPLIEQGYQVEAKAIFDLIDPLSFFDTARGFNIKDEQMESLDVWFFAARCFESLDDCLKIIKKYRFKVDDHQRRRDAEPADDATNDRLHAQFRVQLACNSIYARRWPDFETLSADIPRGTSEFRGLVLTACRVRLDDGEEAFSRQILEDHKAENFGRDLEEKLTSAEIAAKLKDFDRCKQITRTLTVPAIKRGGFGSTNGFEMFDDRFRYYRLVYFCGERRDPVDIIKSEPNGDEHTVHFLRALALIARLWAKAWRGEPLHFFDYRNDLNNVLRIYHKDRMEMEEWKDGTSIIYSRDYVVYLIVSVCALGRKEMMDGLCGLLDTIWDGSGRRYWSPDGQIQEISRLVRAGASKDWAKGWLTKLWPEVSGELNAEIFVSHCSMLAEAWLATGDVNQAKQFFDTMLQRAFGVGDRKDHQLTMWVQLFEELAPTLPDKGLPEIEWLAQRMTTLEDEVASYACKEALAELLGVCVSTNLDRAGHLFAWMEDKECIHYEEALRSMLERVVQGRHSPMIQVLEFIGSILVPISTSAAPGILRDAMVAFNEERPGELASRIPDLVKTINTQAPSNLREQWLNGVARGLTKSGLELSAFGLDPSHLNWREQYASRERVSLQDGTSRAFGDLEVALTTPEKVLKVVGQEEKSSHFAWASLLTIIADRFDAPGIVKIVTAFEGKREYWAIIEAVSKRLVALGQNDVLWDLCLKGIESSKGKTWQRSMDGAPRLLVFTALMRADPNRGRPLLFQAVGAEGAPYHDNIRHLLPYLVAKEDYPAVWAELKNHVAALVAGTEQGAPAAPNLSGAESIDLAGLLPSIARRNLTHLAMTMRQSAQMFFFKLLERGDDVVTKYVAAELEKDSPCLVSFMEVLDGIAMVAADKLAPLKASLKKAQARPSYDVRALFLEICELCEWDTSHINWNTGSLSPMYNLALPQDSEVPFDFGIFRQHLQLTAHMSGLDVAHLSYRLLQLWRAIAGDDNGDHVTEQRAGRRLENLGLGMTYSKPKVMILTQAHNQLLNELAEAGKIRFGSYRALPFLFRNSDPFFFSQDPAVRPTYLPPFYRRDNSDRFDDAWLMGMPDFAKRIPIADTNGWYIVASTARYRCANGESPTEKTASAILTGTDERPRQPGYVGEGLFSGKVESATDYFGFTKPWDGQYCAVNSAGLAWARGGYYLGFHPALAKRLGWQLSTHGLFTWADSTGRVVAESVWWQDGPYDRRNLHSDIEVAHGWLVLVSPRGMEQLKQSVGPLRRERHAERMIDKHGNTTKAGVKALREDQL